MYRMSTLLSDVFDWPQRLIGHGKTASPVAATQSYLGECEALRGIAILLVVAFHCYLEYLERAGATSATPTLLNAMVLCGNTGVTLFFALSGFLLNLPFMANKPVNLKDFYIKRILRIMPLYALIVIAVGIYRENPEAAIKALLFWDVRLGTMWPWGGVWWSLGVEVQFYLLLPFLHLLWRAPRLRWLMAPIFATACLSYYHISRNLHTDYGPLILPRDSVLVLWPTFLAGAALAAFHVRYGARLKAYLNASPFFSRGGGDVLFLALLLAMEYVLLKTARLGMMPAYLYFFDHVALDGILWTLIIGATLYLPARSRIILVNPFTMFFGLISYSFYLLHYPVMFYGEKYLAMQSQFDFSAMQRVAVSAVLAVLVSMITYRLIEKPMLDLKSRFAARRTVKSS